MTLEVSGSCKRICIWWDSLAGLDMSIRALATVQYIGMAFEELTITIVTLIVIVIAIVV